MENKKKKLHLANEYLQPEMEQNCEASLRS